jgi:hypothetical protein
MRTSILQASILSKMTLAGALLTASAMSAPVEAMPASDAGLRAARDAISPIEQAACWQHGSHGWGWYLCCGPPPPPPPYAAWDYVLSPNCRDVTVRENHWGKRKSTTTSNATRRRAPDPRYNIKSLPGSPASMTAPKLRPTCSNWLEICWRPALMSASIRPKG